MGPDVSQAETRGQNNFARRSTTYMEFVAFMALYWSLIWGRAEETIVRKGAGGAVGDDAQPKATAFRSTA